MASQKAKGGGIPQGTTHFQVYRLRKDEGTGGDGKKYSTWRMKRLSGDPDGEGRVTQQWPIREFSPAKVRRRWGPGRYRIRYVTEAGDLLGSEDMQLETPAEEVTGEPLDVAEAPIAAGSSPMSRLRNMAGRTLDGGGVMELMLLLQDTADRSAARARDEAERNAERDRQFFAQMQAQQQQTLAMFTQHGPAAAAGGAAPRVVGISRKALAREMKLLRRELALEQREEMIRIREELASDEPDDDDDRPRPKNAKQAAEQAGIAAVEGIGEQLPVVIGAGLEAIRKWLKKQGQPTDAASVAAAIAAVQQAALLEQQREAEANGSGGAHAPNPQ